MDRSSPVEEYSGSEIAIIGMVCRFPGASDVEEYWRNLRDGIETIRFLGDDELEHSDFDQAAAKDSSYIKAASVLDDIDLFDAQFFGLTPAEAEIMDPQQRIFLECSRNALEVAGYNPNAFKGAIGVFAGARTNTYLYNLFSNREALGASGPFEVGLGNDLAFLPTRVSYALNLRGPSYAVHTACSTSLVAVHLACQSLLIDECQMALAGGVAINVPHKVGYHYKEGSILSPDGHCHAFDSKAHGTVFGSGVGIVVLKRLEDALADGDRIHAIIKGSAANNDGANKASFTAPSVNGQAAVIAEALANAGVAPETITYLEAHGTGTSLGDPIEVRALTKAFRTGSKNFCAIGSVKSNFGHLDAAAGIASLIKVVLALDNKALPPTLNFEQPNPQINFDNSPFYVNSRLSEWETNGAPRRAGVSSFGIGGTNAHVILEEAPAPSPSTDSRRWQLLMLSAKTSASLEKATSNLVDYLKRHRDASLADIAYTLHVGREVFNHRLALLCDSVEDAAHDLETVNEARVFTGYQESSARDVVFMFPGQGAQHLKMGYELYLNEPYFREQVDYCCQFLERELGVDLREILYLHEGEVEAAQQKLAQTWMAQPALFVIEYALAKLWISWGVRPKAMIGHSIGEYAAACLAGVFSIEDALMLISARGRMVQSLPVGAMTAVPLPENEIKALLTDDLCLAAINGPSLCVVSGQCDAIERLEIQLGERGVAAHRLNTSHAFHSQMMAPIVELFTEKVKEIRLNPPVIPFISNVTGTWISEDEATDPAYWGQHLRRSVLFAEGLKRLSHGSDSIFLEVGPGQTLTRLAKRRPDRNTDQVVLASLPQREGRETELIHLFTTLGKLWLASAQIDWSGFYSREQRRRVPLPTYPFERSRYWIAPGESKSNSSNHRVSFDKKLNADDWFYMPGWKSSPPITSEALDDLSQYGQWMIFDDGDGLGDALAKRLQQQPHVIVKAGQKFERVAEGIYSINPARQEDYSALMAGLREVNIKPGVVIHLWGTKTFQSQSSSELADHAEDQVFYSLINLAQELSGQDSGDSIRLVIVSSGLHAITGEEVLCPEKAMLLGPCKVIAQEYTNFKCCSVDVTLPKPGSLQQEDLVEQILAEACGDFQEQVVAYRGGQRWLQSFEPLRLQHNPQTAARLRRNGTYMIIGGLGGVGFLLAEHLARSAQAKLILVGRSALPPRSEWDQWLANKIESGIGSKIQKVQALEALGAEVLIAEADVADLEKMRAVVQESIARFGELHGVIHAAGVAGGGLIQLKTRELAQSVIAPKVRGLLVLDALLKNVRLDFLALFSSISSILGEFGQVDYCAANAFLDAYAHSKREDRNRLTISINWPAWKEVGMALAAASSAMIPPEVKALLREEIEKGMSSAEGIEAFDRILSSRKLPQVVISTKGIQAAIETSKSITRGRILEALEKNMHSRASHVRPALKNSYVAPTSETEQTIAGIWESLLGIKEIGINDNFFDLGGHSLLATQLVARMQSTFRVDLPLGKFFEAPTVSALARMIETRQADQEDTEKMEILKLLTQLSEEEVETELARRTSQPRSI